MTGLIEAITQQAKADMYFSLWSFACEYNLTNMREELEILLLNKAEVIPLKYFGSGERLMQMSSRGQDCAAVSLLKLLQQTTVRISSLNNLKTKFALK